MTNLHDKSEDDDISSEDVYEELNRLEQEGSKYQDIYSEHYNDRPEHAGEDDDVEENHDHVDEDVDEHGMTTNATAIVSDDDESDHGHSDKITTVHKDVEDDYD